MDPRQVRRQGVKGYKNFLFIRRRQDKLECFVSAENFQS